MTAQFNEILHFQGDTHCLCTHPLSTYFKITDNWPDLPPLSSACWRGYVGTWVIENDRLFLLKITTRFQNEAELLSLNDLFPGYEDKVFAHWFSGVLRCSQGECIKYVHMGYQSIYEADLFIQIRRGIVIAKEVIKNSIPEKN